MILAMQARTTFFKSSWVQTRGRMLERSTTEGRAGLRCAPLRAKGGGRRTTATRRPEMPRRRRERGGCGLCPLALGRSVGHVKSRSTDTNAWQPADRDGFSVVPKRLSPSPQQSRASADSQTVRYEGIDAARGRPPLSPPASPSLVPLISPGWAVQGQGPTGPGRSGVHRR